MSEHTERRTRDIKSIEDLKYIPYPTLRNAMCWIFHNIDKLANDGIKDHIYITCELDLSGELKVASNCRELIFDLMTMLVPSKLRKYDKISFTDTWNDFSELKQYSFSLTNYTIKETALDLSEKLDNGSYYLFGGAIPCAVMQIIQEDKEKLEEFLFIRYHINRT